MFVESYLSRIKYPQIPDVSLETLKALHYQHQLHIPIENLDIHAGKPIRLDLEAIFDKVIINKRGGFCYELNGLFHQLLLAIGFKAEILSGRVFVPTAGGGYFREEFDHLAILVTLAETRWLADVAMGRMFSIYPLQLLLNQVQTDRTGHYRIISWEADYLAIQQRTEQSDWQIAYLFTLQLRQLQDFEEMCVIQQTSPDSYFTRNKLCTKVTPEGRITLTDDKLKITAAGITTELPVENPVDFTHQLKTHFDICL